MFAAGRWWRSPVGVSAVACPEGRLATLGGQSRLPLSRMLSQQELARDGDFLRRELQAPEGGIAEQVSIFGYAAAEAGLVDDQGAIRQLVEQSLDSALVEVDDRVTIRLLVAGPVRALSDSGYWSGVAISFSSSEPMTRASSADNSIFTSGYLSPMPGPHCCPNLPATLVRPESVHDSVHLHGLPIGQQDGAAEGPV